MLVWFLLGCDAFLLSTPVVVKHQLHAYVKNPRKKKKKKTTKVPVVDPQTVATRATRAWGFLTQRNREVVLIDGDNVRGKSFWKWSAAELTEAASKLSRSKLTAVLFLDHGERRVALSPCPDMSLAFAGPRSTADDAIVDATNWFLRSSNASVAIATSDFGLRARLGYLTAKGGDTSRVRYISSQAILDALQGRDFSYDASYIEPFRDAYRRLAAHVDKDSDFIAHEQTWMRVLLAERLRLLAARDHHAFDDDLLTCFAAAYTEDDDASLKLLSHPLADDKQRLDLVRFADALRRCDSEEDAQEEEEAEEEASVELPETAKLLKVVPVLSRRRRRRLKRTGRLRRSIRVLAPSDARPLNAILKEQRGELEVALANWLRLDLEVSPNG